MWQRYTLKSRAKSALSANYWKCVAAALIVMLLAEGLAASGAQFRLPSGITEIGQGNWGALNPSDNQVISSQTFDLTDGQAAALVTGFLAVFAAVASTMLAVGGVLKIFVLNLLEVGGCKFFLDNAREPASLRELLSGFDGGNYLKNVLTLFLRGLFNGLWFALFIIPGFVKEYEYRMIPYLLADRPDLSWRETFAMSREMMRGNKWRAFVLDLSFLGWHLLNCLTLGLLGIFYVNPYRLGTNAELYLALKNGTAQSEVFE